MHCLLWQNKPYYLPLSPEPYGLRKLRCWSRYIKENRSTILLFLIVILNTKWTVARWGWVWGEEGFWPKGNTCCITLLQRYNGYAEGKTSQSLNFAIFSLIHQNRPKRFTFTYFLLLFNPDISHNITCGSC